VFSSPVRRGSQPELDQPDEWLRCCADVVRRWTATRLRPVLVVDLTDEHVTVQEYNPRPIGMIAANDNAEARSTP
jgi:hypothetical protein